MMAETATSPRPAVVSRFTRRAGRAWSSRRPLDASCLAMHERDSEEVPGDPDGEARPGPHPRPEAICPPDRDDGDPVAAPPGQEDDLDVEDDAGDPLPGEEVVGGGPREALEAALGVLDRSDHPDRREQVEDLAEEPSITGLAGPHVG